MRADQSLILEAHVLRRGEERKIVETPDPLFERVARGIGEEREHLSKCEPGALAGSEMTALRLLQDVWNRGSMNDQLQDSPEALCPRCGAEANWHFLDEAEEIVEIVCPNCGRFEVPRAEFEQAEADIVETEERRE